MPWKCRVHKNRSFTEKQGDKPKCPQCGPGKDFMYWDTGTVEITGATHLKDGSGFKVYVEDHQGKHVTGSWPGYKGPKGEQFLSAKVAPGNTAFLLRLWNKVESAVRTDGQTQGYEFLDCGRTEVGTEHQTYVVLQWCKTGNNYCFHAYPEAAKRPGKVYVTL